MSDATLSSDEEQEIAQNVSRDPITQKILNPRRVLFEPVIARVVDALGGQEAGTYRMGDEVHGCLKDLKKLWRKDDTDDERTVARIFWEKRVLMNDLIPILLLTAGAGLVEDKRAISCADLMSAMTWPIDMAEELAELDADERAEFTQLHQSHRAYKAAILQPAVMSALFGLLLPPLAKTPRERTLRDNQVAALVLHIVRNLAAIRDSEGLQSRLVCALQETHLTDLLLTAASNADADPLLASWNTLVLEILYLLFRGTPPIALTEQPKPALQRLLAAEARTAPLPTSRHSRFGTTITVQSKTLKTSAKALVHTTAPTPLLLDAGKRAVRTRAVPAAEAALADDLTSEARTVLRNLVSAFLKEGAFNLFLSALLKDIRMERSWATGDRVGMWVLAVVRWTITFFLLDNKGQKREFGRVGAAAESGFVSWVLRRMREATEEKVWLMFFFASMPLTILSPQPKGWAALYAGMGCLTQILLLLDAISSSTFEADEADAEAAQTLSMQLIYAGAPLDLALDCLRYCTAATATGRGPAFLDAAVHFAYAVVRMLERRGGGGEAVYVRRAKKRAKKAGDDDREDAADERKKQEMRETTFSLEAFEMKFAAPEITRALLLQLARFKELATEPEVLRRVVSLLHRVAVRAKAEGLFFNVSTLYLFQTILAAQKTFPRDQPHRDLVQLVTYILRKFFKALEEEPFLAVDAFFPKNRGQWKAYSSWEPPPKDPRERTRAERPGAGEVQVKRGFSWSEQLGIVIAALVDAGDVQWVNWTEDILKTVLGQWEKIAKEVDAAKKTGEPSDNEDDDDEVLAKRMTQQLEKPSPEMREKMTDFLIPYLNDDEANAASRNPQLKLLWRLAKFTLMPEDIDSSDLEWFVSADIPPADLQRTLTVIGEFLAKPMNFEGKQASELLTKTRTRTRRRSPSPDSGADASEGGENSDSESASDSDAPKKRKKRKDKDEEKVKELLKRPEYKSAQFIEDSDEEYGDLDAFLEKEKEKREQMALKVAESGNIQPTGTKKRRKKEAPVGESTSKRKKKRKSSPAAGEASDAESEADVFGSRPVEDAEESTAKTRPRSRPKPKPRFKSRKEAGTSSPETAPKSSEMDEDIPDVVPEAVADDAEGSDEEKIGTLGHRKKNRLVISDEED
ncbi:Topoisomerase 1-associated factor 1 [Mycena sanguinolenta]|uniref:Topoisomerase 1-associated factor 1 n=1 Tax=Mycena sanguinolenta TaxID=230812 RepID=A0A8H7D4V3_9AGAR|nr:Topoisomerase 1-associated factor 1 [Mycena sanguinolenta]